MSNKNPFLGLLYFYSDLCDILTGVKIMCKNLILSVYYNIKFRLNLMEFKKGEIAILDINISTINGLYRYGNEVRVKGVTVKCYECFKDDIKYRIETDDEDYCYLNATSLRKAGFKQHIKDNYNV